MAFPVVASNIIGGSDTATTSHPCPLPSGVVAGNLLLLILATRNNAGSGYPTTPSGWTLLDNQDTGAAYMSIYRKVAVGGDATPDLVTPGTCAFVYQMHRITGAHGAVAISTVTTGVSAAPDPGTCTPSWGSADTLWIALNATGNNHNTTAVPSGYGGFLDQVGLNGPTIATATRTNAAASENVGAFTLASGAVWLAWTLGIRPAAIPPVAAFSGTPLAGDTPLVVTFTDASTGGIITDWDWDFGDGATSTEQHPVHVYHDAGPKTVVLTVTNDESLTDTETKADYIYVSEVFVPVPPSNAVIEIRAASPGSSRWGVALWGVGTWSPAGWQDVTPESVDAYVRWGSHQPERGILAEVEAGSWIVDTYDPERLLDPGNPDSPYAADLRAGLPIRISHRGVIVRQGVAEKIAYFHEGTVGAIRVTDTLSLLARTLVPPDSVLADTLYERAHDAISAAGLVVNVQAIPPTGDPPLAPRLEGDRSVWRHIADAAEQTLHVVWIDRHGTVRFREWGGPYDRGRGVDETQLVDLAAIVSTEGLYSVVQADETVLDGGATIERRLTPTPRYGPILYHRAEETLDPGAWADAVLADRGLQTVQYIPGDIYPLSADDVEYFATLEAAERFGVTYTEADVAITGIIVGGEFRVRSKKEGEAVWTFALELAQTADSPLYVDGAEPPEFLLAEAGDEYLYPG